MVWPKSESNSNISLPLSGGGGDIALSLTERREKDGSRPTSSSSVKAGALRPNTPVSTMPLPAEANGGASEELQPPQQAPAKKKKKSKMHTCEICSKKFPRPSGLRTHMNTHNNARPYACGFPGCTRTFGVRSNAKRHLRTHGIIPPPSNPTNGNGEAAYVVGFNPPVIAPERPDASDSGMRDGGVDSVDGLSGQLAKHRLSRAPFFKLRWMPPSLTSRTNSAKLKAVDEATGEISEDEGDSDEEGDEDYGSDRDLDDYGPTGQGGNKDDGPDTKVGIPLLPALSGSISLPSLGVTLRDHHHSSSRGARAPPSRSSSHSSAYSASSSLSSSTNASTVSNSRRSCLCPFSPFAVVSPRHGRQPRSCGGRHWWTGLQVDGSGRVGERQGEQPLRS
ncbi:hypothetical protein DFP72DRAFT_412924 [Ephemerocybe angulata]|uniref:C2H2-type domain-containing protein n=1 Tax=Ephemerocybe angulata TaxID=980116 RepID=A0A8H6IEJ4_9AGAR|nr:hypothetical protein DFP72DRAFT_412924 [Tulosesus angulatus]